MASMNFNTANDSFRKLLGNGLSYIVPSFQRDYSWNADEWDDLWQDIMALLDNEENAHYMGYLVLQSSDNKKHRIIDGQQRLTTISIIILSSLRVLQSYVDNHNESEKNVQRLDTLRSSYIGYISPVTLVTKSKLELNRHNNDFYQDYLVTLKSLPNRGLNSSNGLLKKASNWFYDKIRIYANNDGEKIAQFIDDIVDKLFFTVITVADELNAFKVFETLNARGVKLSTTDLLKNYIFSVINDKKQTYDEVSKLEKVWESIVNILGSNNFHDYLRVYWNSKNKLVRKSDLFKTIRKEIKTREDAFELIYDLRDLASVYSDLRSPNTGGWDKAVRKNLGLLKMFGVRQPLVILLNAYTMYNDNNPKEFEKILAYLVVFCIRYNVICNKQSNEQERQFNKIACKMFNANGGFTSNDFLKEIKFFYPEDDEFISAFSNKEFALPRHKKTVRYLLFSIENYLSNSELSIESDKYSIEHILPENPEDEWELDNNNSIDKFICRLGNMMLLETSINRKLGNASFVNKIEQYNNSTLQQVKYVIENYSEWNESKIIDRQDKMAKIASHLWKINFIL